MVSGQSRRTQQLSKDTATELPEVRSEAGAGTDPVERDPPARLPSTWSQRASLRKRALVKRPLESLGRRKLKDPLKDGLRGHQEKQELERPGL